MPWLSLEEWKCNIINVEIVSWQLEVIYAYHYGHFVLEDEKPPGFIHDLPAKTINWMYSFFHLFFSFYLSVPNFLLSPLISLHFISLSSGYIWSTRLFDFNLILISQIKSFAMAKLRMTMISVCNDSLRTTWVGYFYPQCGGKSKNRFKLRFSFVFFKKNKIFLIFFLPMTSRRERVRLDSSWDFIED